MVKLEQHNDLTALVARLFMSSLFVLYSYSNTPNEVTT